MSSFYESLNIAYKADFFEVLGQSSENPDVPPAPPLLVRQLGGCLKDQIQFILGEDGILRFFLFATRLRQLLFAWISDVTEKTEEEIITDLTVFSKFLTDNRFHHVEIIDPSIPETAKTATRHILWTLSKNVPGKHTLLKAILQKFSPKRFGYEHGPWDYNPNLPEPESFLLTSFREPL